MSIISCGTKALPRELDVDVQVSRLQVETATDLSVSAIVVKDPAGFPHGANRVRYYSTFDSLDTDFNPGDEAYKAGQAFFAQSPRAATFAVAGAFTTDKAAFMNSGTLGALSALQAVADGSFNISIDDDAQDITGLDLTTATSIADVMSTIQAAVRLVASGGYTSATVAESDGRMVITSGTSGDASRVSVLSSAASGTDISGPGFLNAMQGVGIAVDGYSPTTISNELGLIAEAARCAGRPIYGWALESSYRDTADQVEASLWAQSRRAWISLTTNDTSSYDAASTGDVGSQLFARGDFRSSLIFSDHPEEYPDVALMSYMLHVNYRSQNAAVTAKFKNLVGITPANINETQLGVLSAKRINAFTLTGNTARVFREGTNTASPWFIDDLINLDNLENDLETEVYNVFLRNAKVGYTPPGVSLQLDAVVQIGQLYTFNGVLAERRVLDTTRKEGFRIEPPYMVDFTPLELIPTSDFVNRIGPPITMDVNLAGAIHRTRINVNVSA
jgi:hypothetical protein